MSALASSDPLPSICEGRIGGALVQTSDGRELHRLLGVGRDFTSWMKGRIDQYGFVEGVDFVVTDDLSSPDPGSAKARPQTVKTYHLTIGMAKEIAMVENNAEGRRIRRYYIDCERRAVAPAPTIPNFADPAAAARAWAEQYEARVSAERTKAEIGSRREATAMATASREARRADHLLIQLGQSQEYATVKRMQALHPGRQFEWRTLKRVSAQLAAPVIEVFDANYGTVKAYHADAWREAYGLEPPNHRLN